MASFLRSRWSFLLLLAALLLLSMALTQRWSGLRHTWMAYTAQRITAESLAIHGRILFRELMRDLLVTISVIAAVSPASAIASERERGTLTLLLSSPVNLGRIVMEKYLSSQFFVLLVITASLPILSLPLLARGLSADEVVAAVALSAIAALGYGMVGLFCSTLRPKVYETYLITVAVMLAVTIFIPFGPNVWQFISTTRWYRLPLSSHGLQDLSPMTALDRILPFGAASPFAGKPFTGLLIYCVVWTLIGWMLFQLTRWRLSVIIGGEKARRASLERPRQDSFNQSRESQSRQSDFPSESAAAQRPPAIRLERHRQWFGRTSVLLRLLYIALLISVITLPLASQGGSWLFFTMPFLAAAIFTVPLAATGLGSERDSETLDILRTTLVGDRAIIRAKYMVALQLSLMLSLALYLPGLLIMLIYGPLLGHDLDLLLDYKDIFPLVSHPVLLVLSLGLYNAIGVWYSSRFRSVNAALMATTLSVLALLLLPLPVLHALNGLALPPEIKQIAVPLASAPLIVTNPLAILILTSTEGNITLAGLHISSALQPFRPLAPLFPLFYAILTSGAAWRLVRRAENHL